VKQGFLKALSESYQSFFKETVLYRYTDSIVAARKKRLLTSRVSRSSTIRPPRTLSREATPSQLKSARTAAWSLAFRAAEYSSKSCAADAGGALPKTDGPPTTPRQRLRQTRVKKCFT